MVALCISIVLGVVCLVGVIAGIILNYRRNNIVEDKSKEDNCEDWLDDVVELEEFYEDD